jgi:hypothetical protein
MSRLCFTLVMVALGTPSAFAETLVGVCPDGSAFIVQHKKDIPCARAKLVDPNEMPPLRPQLLPRPYPWLVDQQLRDPHNPYNVIDAARKVREARAAQPEAGAPTPLQAPSPAPAVPRATPKLSFGDEDLKNLMQLIYLRQELAPAEFVIEDALGAEQLRIQVAHSESVESQVLSALRPTGEWRVLAFSATAVETVEFHPNFFVVQDSRTFRPDPADPSELGLLVGERGPLEAGSATLGYFLIPARFDVARELEVWWNDRSIEVTLAP